MFFDKYFVNEVVSFFYSISTMLFNYFAALWCSLTTLTNKSKWLLLIALIGFLDNLRLVPDLFQAQGFSFCADFFFEKNECAYNGQIDKMSQNLVPTFVRFPQTYVAHILIDLDYWYRSFSIFRHWISMLEPFVLFLYWWNELVCYHSISVL